ncbi:transposable element Tcb2 transposase [Trichonephila clavipes]|nr:transposable element Tcb2 transposase [Trichonephila clavipes]
MKTRLKTPSTDQSSRRPTHRKNSTRTAKRFIDRHPGTARGNSTAEDWNQVVFSDETRYNLSSYDNRVRAWRPRGERLNPAFALQRHTASTAEAIFQQGNARSQMARLSQDCLRTVTIPSWPARSPDLSSIEPIWDHLVRRVGHPTSLNELESRLQQIWNEMFQDNIQNLYASMPNLSHPAFVLDGVQQGIKSSVLLPYFSEINVPFSLMF